MIGIATATGQERSDLFRIVASKMALEPAIVEKDFWVCYLLDYLASRIAPPLKTGLSAELGMEADVRGQRLHHPPISGWSK